MPWYKEKRSIHHISHALVMIVVFVLSISFFSQIKAAGTYLASGLLGQYSPTVTITPKFTTGISYGGDTGFSFLPGGVTIDTVHHRAFGVDSWANRVLVFNLDNNNVPIDYTADNVLGQADFLGTSTGLTASTLGFPASALYDPTTDRLFVADKGHGRVLVFDTDSISDGEPAVNVLGQADFTSCCGSTTPFQNYLDAPTTLALDANGYLYVGEPPVTLSGQELGNRVVVFDARESGSGQTLCGETTTGIVDGMNASCVIGQPDFTSRFTLSPTEYFDGVGGVAIDTVGERLFVSDNPNNRVLVFDITTLVSGDLTTNVPITILGQSSLSGTSSGTTQSTLNGPAALAYDNATGMLFVSDYVNNRVLVLDARASGGAQSLCGVSHSGIADNMTASCVLGQSDFTSALSTTTATSVGSASGLFYNSSQSLLYVADSTHSRVLIFDFGTPSNQPTAAYVIGQTDEAVTIGSTPQWTSAAANSGVTYTTNYFLTLASAVGFSSPHSVALDTTHHRLFVSDGGNNRVLVFDLDSSNVLVDFTADYVLGQSNFTANTASTLSNPKTLKYDSTNDRLFVATNDGHVYVYDTITITNGESVVNILGEDNPGVTNANAIYGVGGLDYDSATGLLYVVDLSSLRVMIFDARPSGAGVQTICGVTTTGIVNEMNASCVIGQTNLEDSAYAGPTDSYLGIINDVVLDETGNRLFVTDGTLHNRMLVFDISGFIDGSGTNGMAATHVLGADDFVTTGSGSGQDGFGPTFYGGLEYDSLNKRLLVSDTSNNRIMVFNTDPAVITNGMDAEQVIGQADFASGSSGVTQGDFNGLQGIAFDATSRKIYVTDSGNNRVLVFQTILWSNLTPVSLSGTEGVSFSSTLSTLYSQGTVSFEVVSGTLPPGLSLSGSGITGTPTADGAYSFTLRAIDTVGAGVLRSDHLAFTMNVAQGAGGGSTSSGSSSSTGVVIIPPPTTTTGTTGTGTATAGTTGTTSTTTSSGTTSATTTTGTTGTSTTGSSTGTTTTTSGTTGSGTAPGTTGTSGGTGIDPTTTGGSSSGASTTSTTTGTGPGTGGGTTGGTPPIDEDCPGNIFNTIVCIVDDSIDYTEGVLQSTTGQIRGIMAIPETDIIAKSIGIVGILAGALFTLLPVLFTNPLSFSELFLLPARLWSLLLVAFGIKKRNRPWGRVYDSITKQPLDPVYVSLQDNEGKEIASSITDIDGRYGFLVEPGKYRMIPKKTHYSFPSAKLIGKTRDELYLDLYFGYIFEIKESGEVITKNIPMDPDTFDWNEFAKQEQTLMRFYSKRDRTFARIADISFSIGLTVSTIALVVAPIPYNIAIFSLYMLLLVFKEVGFRQKSSGTVVRKGSDIPVPFAIIRVISKKTGVEVLHKVTNILGRYFALVGNGTYDVTIETKNLDGTYTLAMKKENVEIKNGLLKERFEV